MAQKNSSQNTPINSAKKTDKTVRAEKVAKKKGKKFVEEGIIHIHATFNNTIVTLTDNSGNVLAWSSAGGQRFKGSRKGTPFAAQIAADNMARKTMSMGIKKVSIYVKGPGAGRDAAVRALLSTALSISLIRDVTPIPHNGCKPSKRRRV